MGEVAGEFLLAAAGAVEIGSERIAFGIAETFADGDDDSAEALVDPLDAGTDLFEGGRAFGEIDEMGRVVGVGPGEGRSAYDPSGIAADDFDDSDGRGEGSIIGADVADGVGVEAGGGTEAGAVVGAEEIVVDGFGDADDGEGAGLVQEKSGLHGSVATGEEDGTDSLLPAAN